MSPRPASGATRSVVVRNAMALTVSTGTTSGLGLLFWVVAARLYQAHSLGRASGEIAAMTLLSSLAQLNLTSVFVRFLPRAGAWARRFLQMSYAMAAVTSLVLGSAYVLSGLGHGFLPGGWRWSALFVGAVVLWTIFALQDGAMTGLRATVWVPVENTAFAVAKLALLPALLIVHGQGIFLAWTLPVIAAVAGVTYALFRRIVPHHISGVMDPLPAPRPREIRGFLAAEYVNGIVQNCSILVLPLLVIGLLGATQNGYFATPWLVGTSFSLFLWNVGVSFVVETARDETAIRVHLQHGARMIVRFLMPAAAVVVVIAPELLRPLGAAYAAHGSTLLRLLALAMPFTSVIVLYGSLAWLAKRLWRLVAVELGGTVAFLGASVPLLHRFGLSGVGIGYLATQAAMAAILLPSVVRSWRTIRDAEPPETPAAPETPEAAPSPARATSA
jgi:O-antigen/teichoic acid export membrane protein